MKYKQKKVIIIGASGHALVVADVLRLNGYSVIGYVDTVSPERKGEKFGGSEIIGGIFDIPDDCEGVALGFGNCRGRLEIFRKFKAENIKVISAIHPSAFISENAVVEEGVFVGANSVIETGCKIGCASLINCNASICHGTYIGESVTVCPGVSIAGNVNVGKLTWIGIGSCVIEHVSIGDDCYIGAGAVVVNNIASGYLAYGIPAKEIRKK